MMGSIGGRAEPGGGAPLGDCATMAAGKHSLSLHAFFSSGRTEPLFLAVTMAAVAWLLRVDLSPSWPDPSSGLWVHCEAARGRLGVGASLGDHGASAAPSTLPLSGSGGGHGAAVEAGVCAVGSGGVAGGRQGAGGGLGRSPLPPAPLRRWPWRLWWRATARVVGGGRQLRQRRVCRWQRESAWSATARWAVEHCCSCRARVWWRRRSSWQMLVG
jgi:hypothetical protein